MKIAIPKERRAGEARVAASADTVRKLIGLGAEVVVESGAGLAAAVTDDAYKGAGATIAADEGAALAGADIILKVQRPLSSEEGGPDEIALIPEGAILIAMLAPYAGRASVERLAARKITAFAMELLPRITRAQTMDVLSSQSNLAGYRAVIDAAHAFGRALPMMMTAAGTIAPAKVVVMGAGVAGLQAIATARRLGAVVSAFDVRRAAKEQVQSLGASFIEVDADATKDAETAGGYAKEMDEAYKQKQEAKIHETLKKQDIVITTALIPGKPAPRLVSEAMVKDMRPGSVIVDLAAEQGGNCALTQAGKVVVVNGVTIIGHTNTPSRIAVDASALYARNILSFLGLVIDGESKSVKVNWEDEIIKATLLTRDGAVVHPSLVAPPPADGARTGR